MKPARTPLLEAPLPNHGLRVTLGGAGRPLTLTRDVMAHLGETLVRWQHRPGLRWIAFVSSHDTTFLAGADFRQLRNLSPCEAHEFARMGQDLYRAFRNSPLWLVACIHGAVMGGGLDFALACDYRLAAPASRFSHPGPRLGLLTGWGGTVTLPRKTAAGTKALLRGDPLTAREALSAGWIEEVAADPLRTALRRARASRNLDLRLVKEAYRFSELPFSLAAAAERRLGDLRRSPMREGNSPQRRRGAEKRGRGKERQEGWDREGARWKTRCGETERRRA